MDYKQRYTDLRATVEWVLQEQLRTGNGIDSAMKAAAILAPLQAVLDKMDAPFAQLRSEDLYTAPVAEELERLTSDELLVLKKAWVNRAREAGVNTRVRLVTKELGETRSKKHGQYFIFAHGNVGVDRFDYPTGDLTITHDTWNGYYAVTWHGKVVMTIQRETEKFVPGEWVRIVDEQYPLALAKRQARDDEKAERDRLELISQLGGS